MSYFILIGMIAGFSAAYFMQVRGYTYIDNMVIGVIGSYFGGFLFRQIAIAPKGALGEIMTAVLGAITLLGFWVFMV